MSSTIELVVPDLGDFSDVEIIEVPASPGDQLEVGDSIIVLETDKASMDIPATHAGKISAVHVSVGDKVSAGDAILEIEAEDQADADKTMLMSPAEQQAAIAAAADAAEDTPEPASAVPQSAELVVIGSGPAAIPQLSEPPISDCR